MTLHETQKYFQQQLASLYSEAESLSMFRLLAEDLGFSTTSLIVHGSDDVTKEQSSYFEDSLKRLLMSEPVQYIRGKADFYGLQFSVNQSVLIPRQETEELVDLIIRENPEFSGNIVDLGTGSGCIAISLKKNLPQAMVTAVDISEQALATAKKNAENLHAEISFLQGNMQDKSFISTLGEYSIIVSNPPYVCNAEKSEMKQNVLRYEPHIALFVDMDSNPLQFYDALAQIAVAKLSNGGKMYCEINEMFGKETVQLFESYGFTNCHIHKDLCGKDRIVSACKNSL